MSRGKQEPFKIYKCVCEKTFIPTHNYLYKLKKGKNTIYYCSYTCWRKAGGGNGNYR